MDTKEFRLWDKAWTAFRVPWADRLLHRAKPVLLSADKNNYTGLNDNVCTMLTTLLHFFLLQLIHFPVHCVLRLYHFHLGL